MIRRYKVWRAFRLGERIGALENKLEVYRRLGQVSTRALERRLAALESRVTWLEIELRLGAFARAADSGGRTTS